MSLPQANSLPICLISCSLSHSLTLTPSTHRQPLSFRCDIGKRKCHQGVKVVLPSFIVFFLFPALSMDFSLQQQLAAAEASKKATTTNIQDSRHKIGTI